MSWARHTSTLALGLAACQRDHRVRFTAATALGASRPKPAMIDIDELGFVPLSKTGAELLLDTVSQRHERASTLVTSNLPFEE
jgi:DNA replication protein DnaC